MINPQTFHRGRLMGAFPFALLLVSANLHAQQTVSNSLNDGADTSLAAAPTLRAEPVSMPPEAKLSRIVKTARPAPTLAQVQEAAAGHRATRISAPSHTANDGVVDPSSSAPSDTEDTRSTPANPYVAAYRCLEPGW